MKIDSNDAFFLLGMGVGFVIGVLFIDMLAKYL